MLVFSVKSWRKLRLRRNERHFDRYSKENIMWALLSNEGDLWRRGTKETAVWQRGAKGRAVWRREDRECCKARQVWQGECGEVKERVVRRVKEWEECCFSFVLIPSVDRFVNFGKYLLFFYASFSAKIFLKVFFFFYVRLSLRLSYEVLLRQISDFCFTEGCFVKTRYLSHKSSARTFFTFFRFFHVSIVTRSFFCPGSNTQFPPLISLLNRLSLCGEVFRHFRLIFDLS